MADNMTLLQDLINPQVMADMINAKLEKKIAVLPFAKVDTTLQGTEGATIDIPRYEYIGDAVDVAEGEEIPIRKMSANTKQYSIKMAGVGTSITDKAVLSAHGGSQVVGVATTQLMNAISAKIDNDAMTELLTAPTAYQDAGIISYNAVVNAIDLFEEEVNTDKVIFVHPKQLTQLRLDDDFVSKEKYGNQVMVDGEIGIIGNARIVPSKKVPAFASGAWYKLDSSGALTIVASGGDNSATVDLDKVTPSIPNAKVGDKVTKQTTAVYFNPIVKTEGDAETEDDLPALTYFIKRDTNVETDRLTRKRATEVTADQFYTVGLTNEEKVVILKCLQVASV